MKVIWLAGKKVPPKFVIVDDEDFEYLSQWNWNIIPKGYAIRTDRSTGKKLTIYMHKEIYFRATGQRPPQVDHKNGHKRNNLRENLRAATNQQNQANVARQKNNTSGFKGVGWHKSKKKWQARIGVNYKRILIGLFDNPAEAHEAYCKAAKEYFGEFARS